MVPIMASALSFSAAFYVGFTTKPKHANEKTAGELSN